MGSCQAPATTGPAGAGATGTAQPAFADQPGHAATLPHTLVTPLAAASNRPSSFIIRAGRYFPSGTDTYDDLAGANALPELPGVTVAMAHKDPIGEVITVNDEHHRYGPFTDLATQELGQVQGVVLLFICGATRTSTPGTPDLAALLRGKLPPTAAGVVATGGFIWEQADGVRTTPFKLDAANRPVLKPPPPASAQSATPDTVPWL